eukprot:CAMPEP_0174704190 /NCGR_PEP_ID=MMETSP1094-20130205/7876_1 /TAXON_ID=156173 /ORGANISM="Chrysochromulina brevifilum, Strain UTEX LB 985" /LENGTH=37 /DNA_ID= /DNA_START= /DNA_END= /DNA_ORIENTATION=
MMPERLPWLIGYHELAAGDVALLPSILMAAQAHKPLA